MAFTIQVRMKKLGKQKSQDLQPVPFELAQKPETVRELLTSLTALGVKDYNTRKAVSYTHLTLPTILLV